MRRSRRHRLRGRDLRNRLARARMRVILHQLSIHFVRRFPRRIHAHRQLQDIVGCPVFHRLPDILEFTHAGQHHELRGVPFYPCSAEELHAVHLRHHDIGQHEIGRIAPDHLQRLGAVACLPATLNPSSSHAMISRTDSRTNTSSSTSGTFHIGLPPRSF